MSFWKKPNFFFNFWYILWKRNMLLIPEIDKTEVRIKMEGLKTMMQNISRVQSFFLLEVAAVE